MAEETKPPALPLDSKYCDEHGHFFHSGGIAFARDAQGVAFRGGPDWHSARKYAVYVCQRCLLRIEVKISPVVEQRPKGSPFQERTSSIDKTQKLKDQQPRVKIHA